MSSNYDVEFLLNKIKKYLPKFRDEKKLYIKRKIFLSQNCKLNSSESKEKNR